MFYCAIQYILILLLVLKINCQSVEVTIPQGTLRGDSRTNIDGGTYYAFKNIPFAKPPLGELRFKAPEAADGWDGVRDATEEMPRCWEYTNGQGEEDCLYLNVFTPEVFTENVTPKPVMVMVHGGAFRNGAGQESGYRAQLLLTKDVLLVTINYRLGVFGFLSLDDPNLGITGNAGLKDQVLALQWIKDNIEYFGGDANNVVLMGQSAGSMSVHRHLLSPMSTGLFHKAISESGTAFSPTYNGLNRNNALLVAERLGIQTEDWEDMSSSLQQVPDDELFQAYIEVGWNAFIPIVEIESNAPTFMSRTPTEIIESGDFNQVPYLNGVNNLEGLGIIEGTNGTDAPLIKDFTSYIPKDLEIESGSEAEQDIVQRIIDFYYDGKESSSSNPYPDIQLKTDYSYTYPHYRAIMGQVKSATQPIYFYYFTADTILNSKNSDPEKAAFQGAYHSDELGYLYYRPDKHPNLEAGSVEERAWRNMVDMWTNFAIYGNPTPNGFDFTWEPFDENQQSYLHIDTEDCTLKTHLLQDNMDFWDAIYEDYYPYH